MNKENIQRASEGLAVAFYELYHMDEEVNEDIKEITDETLALMKKVRRFLPKEDGIRFGADRVYKICRSGEAE